MNKFLEFGDDPILVEARSRIPEPSQFKSSNRFEVALEYMEGPKYPKYVGYNYDFKKDRDTRLVTSFFKKRLIIDENGTAFYVWISELDGKVYI